MDSVKFLQVYRENFNIPDNYVKVKRVDISEYELIDHLKNDFKSKLFADYELKDALQNSFCTLGIENDERKIVAVVCFQSIPIVPAVPPDDWEQWLHSMFSIEAHAISTLFISYIGFEIEEESTFLTPILFTAFFEFNKIEDIYLLVPPECVRLKWLKGIVYKAKKILTPSKVMSLRAFKRSRYSYEYKSRKATEEDNDNIIPLIGKYSEKFTELYGNYYVSEIVRNPMFENRKIIIAEYMEKLVGVMFLNTKVNYRTINYNFDMECYQGLKSNEDYRSLLRQHESLITHSVIQPLDITPVTPISSEIAMRTNQPTDKESLIGLNDEAESEINEEEEEEEEENKEETSEHELTNTEYSDISLQFSLLSTMGMESDDSSNEDATDYYASSLLLEDIDLGILNINNTKLSTKYKSERMIIPMFDHRTMGQVNIPVNPTRYWQSFTKIEGNAFAIEVIAIKEGYEDVVKDLLQLAFICIPNVDYAILSVPTTEASGLINKYFVKAPPQSDSFFPHDLYIVNKHSLFGHIYVRETKEKDKEKIEEMLSDIKIINNYLDLPHLLNTPHKSFVFYFDTILFGYAIVKPERHMDYLISHYNLKKWNITGKRPDLHGRLELFAYSPVFQNHWQFFLRELHRFSGYDQIYYTIKPEQDKDNGPVTGLVENLILAQPFHTMQYNLENLDGIHPTYDVLKEEIPYSLLFSTIHHISLPRITVNEKIVVVGASTAGITFLMGLISAQYMTCHITFGNLSLLTPHKFNSQNDEILDQIFMTKNYLTRNYIGMYSLDTYVNMIYGTMTELDRKNKRIKINNVNYLRYDYLILTCGEQYQTSNIAINNKNQSKSTKLITEPPKNVYVINTDVDANYAINDVKNQLNKKKTKDDYTIIIYGYSIEIYSCLATLLKLGIPGKNIKFIRDESSYKDSQNTNKDFLLFNDPRISDAIKKEIIEAGITVLYEFILLDWTIDTKTNRILKAKFESRHKILEIECLSFFMYSPRTVSKRTLNAIINAGLVFDGKIVIDNQCRTNDPYIYAAGSFTKYSRKYYADHLNQEHFNSMEIGFKLARSIKYKLTGIYYKTDTTIVNIECDSNNRLVPSYKWPLITVCSLPGDLNYVYIRKPGKPVPRIMSRDDDDYGQILKTGTLDNLKEMGYFRLHLNIYDQIETITCLSKQKIDTMNLVSIVCQHETLLNNLKFRFKAGYISDLFEYFKEPWATALYHESYKHIGKDVRLLLARFSRVPDNSIIEDLMKTFAKRTTQLTEKELELICHKFVASDYLPIIKKLILDYLTESMNILPMYAQPVNLKYLLANYETSSLFVQK